MVISGSSNALVAMEREGRDFLLCEPLSLSIGFVARKKSRPVSTYRALTDLLLRGGSRALDIRYEVYDR